MELDLAQSERSKIRTELVQAEEKIARLETDLVDAERQVTSALGDLATKRIMVSDLETRLMTQTARGNDFERALNERQSELSDERLRLAELAKTHCRGTGTQPDPRAADPRTRKRAGRGSNPPRKP